MLERHRIAAAKNTERRDGHDTASFCAAFGRKAWTIVLNCAANVSASIEEFSIHASSLRHHDPEECQCQKRKNSQQNETGSVAIAFSHETRDQIARRTTKGDAGVHRALHQIEASGAPGEVGGTLFLDEIGDLPLEAQAKLLRTLQERKFERLGAGQTIASDFRSLAATNQNLEQLVAEGRFREDLLYRLNVVKIELPPLRTRRTDTAALAEHFLHNAQAAKTDPPSGFSEEALRALMTYDYPGNVRELRNIVERAVVLAQGPLITAQDLPFGGAGRVSDESDLTELMELPLEQAVAGLERRMIERALDRAKGNKAEAARILGINRQYLYSKLRDLGIG
jgi:transcriptional regulator of acetoin/glycerol metabolism